VKITGWWRGLDVTGASLGDHPLIATCDNTGEQLSKLLSARVEEHFLREHFRVVAGPPGLAPHHRLATHPGHPLPHLTSEEPSLQPRKELPQARDTVRPGKPWGGWDSNPQPADYAAGPS
jgi:hypothetical protein